MKKLAIIFALLFCLGTISFANDGNGLFQRGEKAGTEKVIMDTRGGFPGLPGHGETGDQPAPVGNGALILTAFGVCYLIGRKNKEQN